jgi:hypothetical protein
MLSFLVHHMSMMDLDRLFLIAEAAPMLDKVETDLRSSGQTALSERLLKLQQDAALEIDRQLSRYDETESAPGPQTARITSAYEPMTTERRGVLFAIKVAIADDSLESPLSALIQGLNVAPAAASPSTPLPRSNILHE